MAGGGGWVPGLGHHVKALFEKMPEDAALGGGGAEFGGVEGGIFSVGLLPEMLGSGRAMIFTSLDRGCWWSGWSRSAVYGRGGNVAGSVKRACRWQDFADI